MPKTLNNTSTMPQMGAAFSGWQNTVTLNKIVQVNNRGDITDQDQSVPFEGVVQPLSPEQVQLKPEGQRSWEWLQLHVFAGEDTNLQTNDRVIFNTRRFKVMAVKDYSLNNYVEYHLLQDYQTP